MRALPLLLATPGDHGTPLRPTYRRSEWDSNRWSDPWFFIMDQAERPYPACFAERSKRDLIRIHLLLPVCLPEAQEFRTLVNFERAAQLTEDKMKGERRKPS